MEADVGNTPQLEVPALAMLSREIEIRPPWQRDTPLRVDTETWKRAREEMLELQRRRGFSLATAAINRVNFLLRGVPVVMIDG